MFDSVERQLGVSPLTKRLRQVRLDTGLRTQREFARLVGISTAEMSQLLSGNKEASPRILRQIAHATNTDLAWLSGTSEMPPSATTRAFEALRFTTEMLDSPANFEYLLLGIEAQRAKVTPTPLTLRQVLEAAAMIYAHKPRPKKPRVNCDDPAVKLPLAAG